MVLDRPDLSEVIDWMPHGRAFLVHRPKLFASDVLPRFFRQTKFLSFTRQLNLWGFKRITRGMDAGAYYHELFLRGRPYMAMRMRRQKIKGTGMKLTPNPEGEPNFYKGWPPVPGPKGRTGAMPGDVGGGGGGVDRTSSSSLARGAGSAMAAASNVGGVAPGGAGTGAAAPTIGGGGGTRSNVSLNADAAMMDALLRREHLGGMMYAAPNSAPSAPAAAVPAAIARPPWSGNDGPSSNFALQFGGKGAGNGGLLPSLLPGQQQQHHGYGGVGGNTNALVENAYGDLIRSTPKMMSPYDNASLYSYLSEQFHPSSNNGGGVSVVVGSGNNRGGRNNVPPPPGVTTTTGMMEMMAMMGGGYNPNNDPNNSASVFAMGMEGKKMHEEISAFVQGRGHPRNPAAANNSPGRASGGAHGLSAAAIDAMSSVGGVVGGGMAYPQQQQLSSDRLLMERLRDLDKLQQVKRERQENNLSLIRNCARLLASTEAAASGVHPGGGVVNGLPEKSSGDSFNVGGTGNNTFDQSSLDLNSSWMYALREANHIEELALAQRAKARSLAMAGALSRFGGSDGGGGSGVGGGGMSSASSLGPSPAQIAFEQRWKQLMSATSPPAADATSSVERRHPR
jgi:hypothetical protein